MASCRSGRLPMIDDPLFTAHQVPSLRKEMRLSILSSVAFAWLLYSKYHHSHHYQQYKGPENPYARIRHKRFPRGAMFYGWGNNGINRDCGLREWECWTGYHGKEYTF